MLTIFNIIRALLIIFVSLQLFEFLIQVVFVNLVLLAVHVSALPLHHVQEGKNESEYDHAG